MSNKFLNCLLGILLAVIPGGCKKDSSPGAAAPPQYDKNYYGRQPFIIALNSKYQYFDSALKKTGLIDTLAGAGPYTTFLLDNNAIGSWGVDNIPLNASLIMSSLIIPGDHSLQALPFGQNQRFATLAGNHVYVSKYHLGTDSAAYLVNGNPVYQVDISTTNGHINVLDNTVPNLEKYSSVLAYVQGSTDLTFLAFALKRTGLDKLLADTTRTWTLLAPSDAAFRQSPDSMLNSYDSLVHADTARLSRILQYHILVNRSFYADLTQLLTNTDTTMLAPILPNATPVKFYATHSWNGKSYYFIGPGNWSSNGSNPPVANPAQIYQPNWYTTLSDNIAVNGNIQQISNILLP